MSSFDTHQTLVKRLKELSDKLSSSSLTQVELEEFETLARKLYERTVILNYKAKEEVFKNKEGVMEIVKEEVVEEKQPEPTPEPVKEEKKPEPTLGEFAFDFTEGFEEEEEEEIKEEPVQETVVETPAVEEKIEEKVEETIIEIPNNGESQNEFYNRFIKANQAAATDKLGNAKLDSLKGAFGLNDRLLFIRELFGGNADDFNATVDILDKQNDSTSALSKLSQIAMEKSWEKDSNTVDEFAHLVIRRYVD